MSYNDNKDKLIVRKLGCAELVYDYELQLKGCILPITLLFNTQHDLFNKKDLIDQSISLWKQCHPLLCCKIAVNKNEKLFSRDRFFQLAENTNFDNIRYYRLESMHKNLWMLLHERELNADIFDCANGPLWRLNFVQINSDQYCLIFTVHHALVDARNCFSLVNHLLSILESLIENKQVEIELIQPTPSIEEKLFENNEQLIRNIKLNEKYEITPYNKISPLFKNDDYTSKNIQFLKFDSGDKFVELYSKIGSRNEILISDLIKERNDNKLMTKFVSFKLEENVLNNLLQKCKKHECKLTGCLNMICALATYDLYKNYNQSQDKICYHMLANLRPFLSYDNLTMGYWAIVLNGILETKNDSILMDLESKFWKLAKKESDEIHERIKNGELIENAKLDMILLDLFEDKNFQFENGGGVHFAISNLGPLTQFENLKSFRLTENYFNTSCAPNRWTSILFNGISTVDKKICWSIGYNSEFINDQVIDYLVKAIVNISEKIAF